ncbi:MAG: alpha/beta hydrolase, partial [Candidatus Hydrogenedens sp.]
YEDWYSALNRGIACVRARCEKVFLCGFSAGGCLVLSASANKQKHIEGVISISAPLKLQNYAINLVPTISTLNLVLKKFGGSGWELFDHHPENPHINYQKNPLAGLQQLRLLMEKTEELLPQITIPALIIQGSNDTTVNPDSANIIFHSISSEQKKLVLFNRARHGILNGSGSEEIFACVSQFIKDIAERKFETTKK